LTPYSHQKEILENLRVKREEIVSEKYYNGTGRK